MIQQTSHKARNENDALVRNGQQKIKLSKVGPVKHQHHRAPVVTAATIQLLCQQISTRPTPLVSASSIIPIFPHAKTPIVIILRKHQSKLPNSPYLFCNRILAGSKRRLVKYHKNGTHLTDEEVASNPLKRRLTRQEEAWRWVVMFTSSSPSSHQPYQ